jgi:hypothetical protein
METHRTERTVEACNPEAKHKPLVERDAHRLEVLKEVAEAVRHLHDTAPPCDETECPCSHIAAALEKGEMP